MGYPVENLFRRPWEFASAATSFSAATALWLFPAAFMVTPGVAVLASGGLAVHGAWRAHEGMTLLKFRRNLRQLPMYVLKASEIPVSDKELFLGMGFRWDQRHTQRLMMARHPSNKHLRARNDLYEWARDAERQHPAIARITRRQRFGPFTNPVAPLPPVGGDPAIHGIEVKERAMWMDLGERVGHTLVLGTTRVGKTRLAEMLITQDIRRGDVVIVFDPKGDAALLKRMYAEAKRVGREHQFYMFHLGYPDISARYSPVGTFGRITEVATRIANQLPSEGQSAAFKEFVWRFVNVMSRAMNTLGMSIDYQAVYQNAVNIDGLCQRYFEWWLDKDHAGWRDEYDACIQGNAKAIAEQSKKTGRSIEAMALLSYIREKNLHDSVADGLVGVLANDRTYFEKLVSSLYPLLEKLTTGRINELLSPSYDDPKDPRPIFDWPKIIDQGGIVYVGLDSLSDPEVAAAVGNSMFADLTSVSGRIYKHGQAFGQSRAGGNRKVAIHADEFNELIGDEFVPLLNKAGGAGYQVTVYTQTWSDVEAKIGSPAKAGQIGGNLNTLIMLRVKNKETAEILTDQLPMVEIYSSTLVSGASDANDPSVFADFSSNTQDRLTTREVPMIQPADLVQLPKGQAFALIEGGQLVKLRLPLASDEDDPVMPESLGTICIDMQRKYQRYIEKVEGLEVTSASNDSSTQLTVNGKGCGW